MDLARVHQETRMPLNNIARAFLALWWTLGVLLVAYSVQTAWHALAAGRGQLLLYAVAVSFVMVHGRVPVREVLGQAKQ
jgi:hypothetical protein